MDLTYFHVTAALLSTIFGLASAFVQQMRRQPLTATNDKGAAIRAKPRPEQFRITQAEPNLSRQLAARRLVQHVTNH